MIFLKAQWHRRLLVLAVLALFVTALIPCLPVGCRVDASTSIPSSPASLSSVVLLAVVVAATRAAADLR